MKYNGKYSLKENLYRGRGMRLLKEGETQPRVTAGWIAEVKVCKYLGADLNEYQMEGSPTAANQDTDIPGHEAECKSGTISNSGGFANPQFNPEKPESAKNRKTISKPAIAVFAELTENMDAGYASELKQLNRYLKALREASVAAGTQFKTAEVQAGVSTFRSAKNPQAIKPFKKGAGPVGPDGKPTDQQKVASIPDLDTIGPDGELVPGSGITMDELKEKIAAVYFAKNSTLYCVVGDDIYKFSETDKLLDSCVYGSFGAYRSRKDKRAGGWGVTVRFPLDMGSKVGSCTKAEAQAYLVSQGSTAVIP